MVALQAVRKGVHRVATKKVEAPFFFYKESHRKDEGSWAQVAPGEIPIGHKRKIFTMRTMADCHWNDLREVVDSSTLDTFKIWLERMLGYLV